MFNYVDTKCLLEPHPIRQEDLVAFQVPSHIGWVCFSDCPSHCLLAITTIHRFKTTSYFLFCLLTSYTCLANLPTAKIVHLFCQVEYASTRLSRCGTGCL